MPKLTSLRRSREYPGWSGHELLALVDRAIYSIACSNLLNEDLESPGVSTARGFSLSGCGACRCLLALKRLDLVEIKTIPIVDLEGLGKFHLGIIHPAPDGLITAAVPGLDLRAGEIG